MLFGAIHRNFSLHRTGRMRNYDSLFFFLSQRLISSAGGLDNGEYWGEMKKLSLLKSPPTLGFSWVTQDEQLLFLMEKHFKLVASTFDIVKSNNIVTADSSVVEIIPVNFTRFNSQQYLQQLPYESISIGGPSALVMAYFEAERYIKKQSKLHPPIFATKNVTLSNAYGSALQIHQRYAQRMAYTDEKYEGWNLLRVGLQRSFSGRTLEDALVPDYLTVDLDWEGIWKKDPLLVARICLKNEMITWRDKFNRWRNRETTGTRTYHYAQESARILESIDSDLGGIFTQEGALSIGLTEKEFVAIQRKNKWLFSRHNIESRPVPVDKLKSEYGLSPNLLLGGGAFYYPSDGCLQYDFWQKLERGILQKKGLVESWVLKQIVIEENHDKVVGVVVIDNGRERFLRTDRVYASLGYNARYEFSRLPGRAHVFSDSPAESITTATGFSGFAIVTGSQLKVPIAFNSHHTTKMAQSWDPKYGPISLVKTTGGALIGSCSQYQIQHGINNVWYNEKIFGPNFRLFAAQGCSRSINAENSGRFVTYPGLVIGSGRGGKGMTDMCADAVVAGQALRSEEPPYRENSILRRGMVDKRHQFFAPVVSMSSLAWPVENTVDSESSTLKKEHGITVRNSFFSRLSREASFLPAKNMQDETQKSGNDFSIK